MDCCTGEYYLKRVSSTSYSLPEELRSDLAGWTLDTVLGHDCLILAPPGVHKPWYIGLVDQEEHRKTWEVSCTQVLLEFPESALERAGLFSRDPIVLIGALDHYEIWAPEKWGLPSLRGPSQTQPRHRDASEK